jgi:hypothetical protein
LGSEELPGYLRSFQTNPNNFITNETNAKTFNESVPDGLPG